MTHQGGADVSLVGEPPKVLLVSTFSWTTAGRLAVALDEAGFVVDAVGPTNSVVHGLGAVRRGHRLGLTGRCARSPAPSRRANPDLVIPSDDPSRQALNRLYGLADPSTRRGAVTRACLARSLGPPETYDEIYSRTALMEIAAGARALCAPLTTRWPGSDEAVAWQDATTASAVMKTDGSWGGRGVEIVEDADDVAAAWRRLSTPPNSARVAQAAGRGPVALAAARPAEGTPAGGEHPGILSRVARPMSPWRASTAKCWPPSPPKWLSAPDRRARRRC